MQKSDPPTSGNTSPQELDLAEQFKRLQEQFNKQQVNLNQLLRVKHASTTEDKENVQSPSLRSRSSRRSDSSRTSRHLRSRSRDSSPKKHRSSSRDHHSSSRRRYSRSRDRHSRYHRRSRSRSRTSQSTHRRSASRHHRRHRRSRSNTTSTKSCSVTRRSEEVSERETSASATAEKDTGASATADITPDLLALLGESTEEIQIGKPLHPFLVERWRRILQNGLSKEKREELRKRHPRPENFNVLVAPKLNTEVEPLLATNNKTKDAVLRASQTGATTLVTILGKTLTELLAVRDDPETTVLPIDNLINYISEAAHISCDIFYGMSSARKRTLAQAQVTPVAKNLILEAVSDEFLLGIDFTEKWKKAKESEKAANEMLKKPQGKPATKPSYPARKPFSRDLNSKAPALPKHLTNVNLVYQSPVLVEGKFLAKVEKDVAWPTLTPNTKDITCIMAINEDTNVDGGYASIVSGGLYEKDVEIRLTSQLGKGLNYTISIYTT
ncbi:unnamed protein product [Brassicogethes aeneus]|uniref:Uncharacterized protein n=1 Tax=Brassicogethes aeneus TaxID=1431903 RepID=A0A9P0APT3_BRAAE|nr:unnamed protein product [Brassicogethes aeneus]